MSGTVLITGATSGLGRELARRLLGSGWTVLAHGRDPGRLDELTRELPTGDVRPYMADLASLGEVRRLAEQVRKDVPRLDVLVNNAAVGFGPPGQHRQVSQDGHELRMAVNYLAPVALARALLPLLIDSAPARVVNVGSIGQVAFDPDDMAFENGYAGMAACRRAKLALAAFTFDLAEELRGTGVTANCVHPATLMNTRMVVESGFPIQSTVREGTEATLRLITDPALEAVTGEFFNGLTPATAHPEAHSREFQSRLRAATELRLGRSAV